MSEGTAAILIDDLDKLLDGAMWAHVHGYWKEGHGLDAEHGTDLSRTEEDRAKGPKYDLDIGSHDARVAYQGAVRAISDGDDIAARVLYRQGVTVQPPVEQLDVYAFPTFLRRCARRLEWRLGKITEDKTNRADLDEIRTGFDKALRGLAKTFEHGTARSALKENPCKTCGIRDRGAKKAECDTCAKWRLPHGGKARPKELDHDSINQARAAAARRRARGEGWGAA